MGTKSVRMPDGQIIHDVPEDITQEELLRQYAEHKVATKQPLNFKEGVAKLMGDVREAVNVGRQAQTPAQRDISSALPNFLTHVASPFAGAAEFAGTAKPSQVLQGVQDIIDEGTGPIGKTAGFAGDIYGGGKALNMLGKAGKYMPKVAQGFKNLQPWEKAALTGTAFGASMPTGKTYGDEDFGSDKLLSSAFGTALGLGAHGIVSGIGNLAAPQLKRLAELEAQGIPRSEAIKQLSFGQIVGGPMQWLENNVFSSIPFAGTKGNIERGRKFLANQRDEINRARTSELNREKIDIDAARKAELAALPKGSNREAIDEINQKYADQLKLTEAKHAKEIADLEAKHGNFSTPMIQKAVEPLGIEIPENLSGHKAIKFAQDEIDKAYTNHLKDIGDVKGTPETIERIQKIVSDASEGFGGLDEASAKRLGKEVESAILKPFEEEGSISAKKWHSTYKELGERAYNFSTSSSQYERDLGQVYRKLQDEWLQLGESADTTGKLKEINSAYKALQPVQRAAAGVESSLAGGEFTPKQLLTSAKTEASIKKMGAGEAPYQQEAIDAFNKLKEEKAALDLKHKAEKDAIEAMKNLEKEQHKAGAAAEAEKTAATKAEMEKQYQLEDLARKEAEAARIAQLKGTIEEVVPQESDKYVPHRFGWGVVAAPILSAATRGVGGEGASVAGAVQNLIGGSAPGVYGAASIPLAERLLYSSEPVQTGLKALATKPRPEMVRKAGESIRNLIESGDTTVPLTGAAYGNLPGSQEDISNKVEDTAAGGLQHFTGPQIPQ